jgi:hypothetical protein
MNLLMALKTKGAAFLTNLQIHMINFIKCLMDPPVPQYVANKDFLHEVHLRRAQALKFFRHFLAAVLLVILAVPSLFLNHLIGWQTTQIEKIQLTETTVEPASKSTNGAVTKTRVKSALSNEGELRPIEEEVFTERTADKPAEHSTIQTIKSSSLRVWAILLQSVTLLALVGGVLWAVVALCRIE